MSRLEYADRNRQRYLDWCGGVESGPFDAVDKLEFAVISAHTRFDFSIDGFLASRGIDNVQDLGNALAYSRVTAPGFKAAAILNLRDMVLYGDTPLPNRCYQDYRREWKLPGLGHCKLSFGACLIDPMGANVVCLDTHILQVYMGRMPSKSEVGRCYRRLDVYEGIEAQLLAEAVEVGLPPFAYQWAVWDWKRARVDHKPPMDHSFLWQGGQRVKQLPLFSGLA